ncbi:hypothetical protein O9G_001396 [Rozella allomycis CSF55]|uniref:Uncharacterized protein n=1 Tax=Rozella allomycis (strain CSF55) TaxID=988480 RepID=A0A075B5C0_ROZAC|nr:hypothetical protein O9G_001396 [Rozella allomycis CSF55]|eukprot:EPZ36951.1 hypothetical protein O9G_001396 [Rozella allomycis CSF55]
MPLKILPKKTFHVQKPENLEKVRHDEEEHRIMEERKLMRREQNEREFRLELMRKKMKSEDAFDETPRPFSILDAPIVSAIETSTEKMIRDRKKEMHSLKTKLKDKHVEKPWYTTNFENSQETPSLSTSQAKRLHEEDPLTAFKKSKMSPGEKPANSTKRIVSSSTTMDKLRRERFERERRERQRSLNILASRNRSIHGKER